MTFNKHHHYQRCNICAIFGISGDEEASYLTFLGLHSLQHRGTDGSGILSTNGDDYFVHRRQGMVADTFKNGSLSSLKGHAAIGHTRYSTTGGDTSTNLQPLSAKHFLGWTAIAHNGNLTNADKISETLEASGSIFQTTTDTEVIMHLMAHCRDMELDRALVCALEQVEGAYSLLVMNKHYMIAVRDPYGFRPLLYGHYKDKPVFASETCAFELIGGTCIREVAPGEMMIVDLRTNRLESRQVFKPRELNKCVFEMIYFARPDSEVFGQSVYITRKALGRRLAKEQPAKADLVVPVPDSGVTAAIGYAEELGLPFEMGIVRSHFTRTFIQPKQSLRDLNVRLKLNAVAGIIKDKRVIVVDDSLVRGTTSKKIIRMLRKAGATEVHLRISAPPTISPCFYGIDTPTKKELVGANYTVEEIRKYVGADSLGYLSLEGLMSVSGKGYCDSCFSGKYPTLVNIGKR